jgi:hypothetical protein
MVSKRKSPKPDLSSALARYIGVLAVSADATSHAEDRVIYTKHLADAARMFAELHAGRISVLRELVESERHGYGWGYLSGDTGAAAESAFDVFARAVEATSSS